MGKARFSFTFRFCFSVTIYERTPGTHTQRLCSYNMKREFLIRNRWFSSFWLIPQKQEKILYGKNKPRFNWKFLVEISLFEHSNIWIYIVISGPYHLTICGCWHSEAREAIPFVQRLRECDWVADSGKRWTDTAEELPFDPLMPASGCWLPLQIPIFHETHLQSIQFPKTEQLKPKECVINNVPAIPTYFSENIARDNHKKITRPDTNLRSTRLDGI